MGPALPEKPNVREMASKKPYRLLESGLIVTVRRAQVTAMPR
jgi:hypothetical protein